MMQAVSSLERVSGWRLEHSYTQLPAPMFDRVKPTPVAKPEPVLVNAELAKALGLGISPETEEDFTQILSGNKLPPGADPLAQAYMGHQFGYPNMLGDGRAILLGEQITPGGSRFDIQLKGPGITRYSRRGDGRATLSAMLREYIISEAMHALGIPTTRSLAVMATGEEVYRETVNKGAVLTRVAESHIRVGTFEFASRHLSKEDFQIFLQYVIGRHYPHLESSTNPALALLEAVMDRQASLITDWMRVGFIHGVMNTDNMSICGETIDYGPCAFMNTYDPETVFSSIDTNGRYAYGNQPAIAQWNLAVFASSLLPLIDDNIENAIALAKAGIQTFQAMYSKKWLAMMRGKLGLLNELTDDKKLADDLLNWMQTNQADYTNTFLYLSEPELAGQSLFYQEDFLHWHERWKIRLLSNEAPADEAKKLMKRFNPVFIPRNHLVEEALQEATLAGSMQSANKLLEVLKTPYDNRPGLEGYRQPPVQNDRFYKTFCGT